MDKRKCGKILGGMERLDLQVEEIMWTEMKRKINEVMPKKKVKIGKRSVGEKVWYDKEWEERKRVCERKMQWRRH